MRDQIKLLQISLIREAEKFSGLNVSKQHLELALQKYSCSFSCEIGTKCADFAQEYLLRRLDVFKDKAKGPIQK